MSGPSITDGVHRNEIFVEIIPVFSTFGSKINEFERKKSEKLKAIILTSNLH